MNMQDNTRTALIAAAWLVAMIVAPLFFYPVFLVKLLCFTLFAASFNLLLGYVGLLSFGHAAFFGTGGYLCAHALAVWGLPPEVALLIAMSTSAVLGAVIGFLAVRRQGIYFAMITLALGQMVYFIYLQAPFTGGEDGILGVPAGRLFGVIDLGNPMQLYYSALAIVVVALAVLWRVIHSPFGSILTAIRENEARAVSLGYIPDRYKLGAFVLAATLAGLAGGVKAMAFRIASLTDVTWQMSGEVVLMTLVGGIGTFFGPIAGAFAIGSMEHFLAKSPVPAPVVIGAAFILCVLLFRRGIIGSLDQWLRPSRKRAAKETGADPAQEQTNNPQH